MPHAFSRRLAAGPLLCDGAMGTMLYARGVPLDACFDVLNVNAPRLVQAIHGDYVAAGADCIETNTFGANRFKLAVHGLDGRVHEINLRGAKLARDLRESAGRDVLVLGSMGPLGKYLAPLGTVTADEARAAFREQAEGLLEGGVDAFVVETFSDLAEIALAIEMGADAVDVGKTIHPHPTLGETISAFPASSFCAITVVLRPRSPMSARLSPRACWARAAPARSRRPPRAPSPCPSRCRAGSASGSSTSPRPRTWPTTPGAWSTPGRAWSAAAAAPRRRTSPRCARCSTAAARRRARPPARAST